MRQTTRSTCSTRTGTCCGVGARGNAPGQFRFENNPDPSEATLPLASVAVDQRDGTVYVAEPQRIQRFDPQGGFRLAWGAPGLARGEFTRITDLTVGPTGTVYALEDRLAGQGRIQEFDPAGSFLTAFGRGQIVDSGGIVVDTAGDSIVADDDANVIRVFSADGRLSRTFGEPAAHPASSPFRPRWR